MCQRLRLPRARALTPISGPPPCTSLGRSLRPMGVPTVRIRWNSTRRTRRASKRRPRNPPTRNGISPVLRPTMYTCRLLASSIASSEPELPAPTSSTGPGSSWPGANSVQYGQLEVSGIRLEVVGHASPMRALPSKIRNRTPSFLRWCPTESPACPPPITMTSDSRHSSWFWSDPANCEDNGS